MDRIGLDEHPDWTGLDLVSKTGPMSNSELTVTGI